MVDDKEFGAAEASANFKTGEVRLKAYRTMDLIMGMTLIGVFGGLFYVVKDLKESTSAALMTMSKEHEEIRKTYADTATAIKEVSWIMTLSQERKEMLELTMPDSLRARGLVDPRSYEWRNPTRGK